MTLRALPVGVPLIAPSMLKCDFADLVSELDRLTSAGAAVLHWDVMDGHFVPNLSYGAMLIHSVRKRTEMFFDAHLMVSDPGKYLDDYVKAGCDAITVHIEAVPEPADLLRRIRDKGLHAGLALNPQTPVERVAPHVPLCDLLLVMSVQPGFGGQKFMPNVLPKVRELRRIASPATHISIDGGVGGPTIADCAQAGANLFVAGSSIFDEADYAAAMRMMAELAAPGVATSTAIAAKGQR